MFRFTPFAVYYSAVGEASEEGLLPAPDPLAVTIILVADR
jgi:hypothetical protein